MFELNTCIHPSCQRAALSVIDSDGKLADKPNYCLKHIPNPESAKDAIYEYIRTHWSS